MHVPCELKGLSLLATNISRETTLQGNQMPAMQTAALMTSSAAHKY